MGTGTSWHAANIGAWFLRAAGVEAWPVPAMDAALHGPRPTGDDGLILLSHRGTKLYTSEALERARADGAATATISARGAPGADIETVAPERSSAYTASHCGALLRLAQIAVALGADLPLEAVPDAVAEVVDGPAVGIEPPRRSMEFIGAGPNQWTAAEGALKVRETAYVAASGMGVEQYLHGPSVAVGAFDTLICLNGGGPGEERLLAGGALGGVLPGAGAGDPRRRAERAPLRLPAHGGRAEDRPRDRRAARHEPGQLRPRRPGQGARAGRDLALGRQSGYSSFRQVRGSAGPGLGARSWRNVKYGATKGSGADTV